MDSTGDSTGQHREGMEHISSNTAPPAEKGESFVSPLVPTHGNNTTSGTTGSNLEQTSSQGGVMGTVKSYLGMGNNTAGSTVETGQLGGTTEPGQNVEDHTIVEKHPVSGSGAGLTQGTGNESAVSSAAGVGAATTEHKPSTTGSTNEGSTMEAAKEKVEEATPSKTEDHEVTSGDSEHKPPKPASGKPHKLENESSIPTAGGERLGEKHWGESKIVPDDPSKRASAAGISSEEGQPTKQTSDNTAKNTGGAAPPPQHDSTENKSSGTGEEKPKMMDKVKDKLHMGSK